MPRTLIGNLNTKVGETVTIKGWVSVRRDQGKMVFFDFRDRSGAVQGVVLPNSPAIETAKEVRNEFVVSVEGKVNERPEKNRNSEVQNGDIELEVTAIEVLSKAEIPFELGSEVNLDTLLDHLPFTLRAERSKDIFNLQTTIIQTFRASLIGQDFKEFQAPALSPIDAEGGAMAFTVNYYYDQKAYLVTSPQLYKQIMVGAFERVFTTAKVFRGEKHSTSRHLSELTQMDFEMGFIKDHYEVLAVLENVMRDIVRAVSEKHGELFKRWAVPLPLLTDTIPALSLREIQDILGAPHTDDLEPEQERAICEWAAKEKGSDFVFVTGFPTSGRAFYTYEEPSEAPYSRGFDLLFRGLEINSGAQRMHDYDALITRLTERGIHPDKFSFYLEAFKVGMPPHGGCSTGLERITARMLNLPNVKEATLFPRDLNRIDTLLSTDKKVE